MTEQMNENERSMKYFIVFALISAVLLPVCGELYVVGDFYWQISNGVVTAAVFIWTAAVGVCFGRLPFRKAMLGCTAFALSSLVLAIFGFAVIHPMFSRGLNDFDEYFKTPSRESYYFEWIFYWAKAFAALGLSFLTAFITLGIRKLTSRSSGEDGRTSSVIDNAFSEEEK